MLCLQALTSNSFLSSLPEKQPSLWLPYQHAPIRLTSELGWMRSRILEDLLWSFPLISALLKLHSPSSWNWTRHPCFSNAPVGTWVPQAASLKLGFPHLFYAGRRAAGLRRGSRSCDSLEPHVPIFPRAYSAKHPISRGKDADKGRGYEGPGFRVPGALSGAYMPCLQNAQIKVSD